MMGRESRVIKPRQFTYWPNADRAKRQTHMTRVTDAAGARQFVKTMVQWYLGGLMTKAERQTAEASPVSRDL